MQEAQDFVKKNKFAASLSIFSNTTLIILKYIAGFMTGSISIISEATHSATDLLASIITLYSVSKSSKPADKEHPFGHGKYEEIASLLEGLLIILASFYIVYESLKKILFSQIETIDTTAGIIIMGVSVVVNFLISNYLFAISKQTGSSALHADAMHLRTDVYSAFGVFIGLLVIKLTGNVLLDAIIAIGVAILIFFAGFEIYKKAEKALLDSSLDDNEIFEIKKILTTFSNEGVIKLKELKTRRSGLKKNILLTLIVDGRMHISTSHKLCDKIEHALEDMLKNTEVTIHLEPKESAKTDTKN